MSNIFVNFNYNNNWLVDLLRVRLNSQTADDDTRDKQKIIKDMKDDVKKVETFFTESKPDLSVSGLIKIFFGWEFYVACVVYCLVNSSLRILQPLLIGKVISNFTNNTQTSSSYNLSFIVVGLIFCKLGEILSSHIYNLFILKHGKRIEMSFGTFLYGKVLKCNESFMNIKKRDEIIDLMSKISTKLNYALSSHHQLCTAPLESLIITVFIFLQMQVNGSLGVTFLCIVLMLLYWSMMRSKNMQENARTETDKRKALISEILDKIVDIKIHCLEQAMAKRMKNIRNREIGLVSKSQRYSSIVYLFDFFLKAGIIVSIVGLYDFDHHQNAHKSTEILTVVAYYHLIFYSMLKTWPKSIMKSREASEVLKKIQTFLIDFSQVGNFDNDDSISSDKLLQNNQNCVMQNRMVKEHLRNSPSIFMRNFVSLGYNSNDDDDEICVLRCEYIEIAKGKHTCLMGGTEDEHRILIQILLGERTFAKGGEVEINGKISFASRNLCLIRGSIKENILLAEEYDEDKYKSVIEMCDLRKDAEALNDYEIDEVSTEDVVLKQKITLARCFYVDADIYIVEEMFDECYNEKWRILLSNIMKKLSKDKICIVSAPTTTASYMNFQHDFNQIISIKNGKLTQLDAVAVDKKLLKVMEKSLSSKFHANFMSPSPDRIQQNGREMQNSEKFHNDIPSQSDVPHGRDIINSWCSFEEASKSSNILDILFTLVKTANNKLAIFFIFLLFALTQTLSSAIDLTLSQWVNEAASHKIDITESLAEEMRVANISGNEDTSTSTSTSTSRAFVDWSSNYVFTFIALCCLVVVVGIYRSFMFFNIFNRICVKIHDNFFCRVTRATIKHFQQNDDAKALRDEIIKSLSFDVPVIESSMPHTIFKYLALCCEIFGIVFIIFAITTRWLILPLFLIMFLLFGIQFAFGRASSTLKYACIKSRNSINSHIAGLSLGLSTIHSTRSEEIFMAEFNRLLYHSTTTKEIYLKCFRMIEFLLQIICWLNFCLILLSCNLIKADDIKSGEMGIAIILALHLIICYREGFKCIFALETQTESLRHIYSLKNIDTEASFCTANKNRPIKDWPQNGQIVFENFFMKMTPDANYVLKDMTFRINSGQKCGILANIPTPTDDDGGRREGGGNLMIAALLRLAINFGSIEIDDINIETIGLHDLRRAFVIIPANPVCYSGTVRSNLDPFKEKTDDVIWEALEHVHLKHLVSTLLPDRLETRIKSKHFQAVERRRQLNLARALLHTNKILIVEESGSGVMMRPTTNSTNIINSHEESSSFSIDDSIMNEIYEKFANCTVIKIASRVETVMDCDIVMVLENGRIVEFGHPYELIQHSRGQLRSLLDQTGLENSMNLIRKAEMKYFQQKQPNSC